MLWTIPGTTLQIQKEDACRVDGLFQSMFMAGGMVLSQVSSITGVESYTTSYNGITLWDSENVAISGTIIRDIRNEWEGEAPYFSFAASRNVTLDGVPLDGNYIGN